MAVSAYQRRRSRLLKIRLLESIPSYCGSLDSDLGASAKSTTASRAMSRVHVADPPFNSINSGFTASTDRVRGPSRFTTEETTETVAAVIPGDRLAARLGGESRA